jgi:PAS domain S-box-containing protein
MDDDFLTVVLANAHACAFRCHGADDGYRMISMTAGIEALTGFPASDFIGSAVRSFSSIINEQDEISDIHNQEEAFRTGRRFQQYYRVRHRDGYEVWVHETSHAVLNADGRIRYIEGLLVDASDLNKAREQSALWESNLTAMVEETARIQNVLGRLRMLALNARIEAARAGQAGLGFTVVATEMKSIADEAGTMVSRIEAERAAIAQRMTIKRAA